ncbi:hypothetical protein [Bradyrhizobium sp. Ash2021]|uniref:hypothetical protein n=1 Tax=Bradyrhizobium sp. Ash2021 TaxID=2954771 RepID=UPI002814AC49|nr:hypothetical protein [Bradyrhizobium sp. Ash2021]WMT71331.1 hypothetical protein NL528_24880 [Bradyrhizobium sp. Ash2021]
MRINAGKKYASADGTKALARSTDFGLTLSSDEAPSIDVPSLCWFPPRPRFASFAATHDIEQDGGISIRPSVADQRSETLSIVAAAAREVCKFASFSVGLCDGMLSIFDATQAAGFH